MKISASVMAHPNRSTEVGELLAALDRKVPVHWDREGAPSGGGDRIWRQARAAWSMYDPSADYHVLIQDDAIVSADFLAGLERALDFVRPGSVVSPYLGTGRNVPLRWGRMTEKADIQHARWIVAGRVMWGVCLLLPVSRIPEMIAWCDRKAGMPDDMRVGAWAVRNELDVWYPWPSLVDHRLVPSLTKSRAADRVARRHHAGSALAIDWSGPVVMDSMLARHRGSRSGPRSDWRVRSAPAQSLQEQEGRNSA